MNKADVIERALNTLAMGLGRGFTDNERHVYNAALEAVRQIRLTEEPGR